MTRTNDELEAALEDAQMQVVALKVNLQAIVNMVDDHSYSAISALQMVRLFASEALAA